MKVGIKSGTFRILHAGHIWCLEQCKKQCDYLIVLTNDDEYLRSHKGIVVTPLKDRVKILQVLKPVDEVGWFSGPTEEFWIHDFKRNRLYQDFGKDAELIVFHSIEIKNNTYIPAKYEADKIIFIDRIPGSTSDIIKDIKE